MSEAHSEKNVALGGAVMIALFVGLAVVISRTGAGANAETSHAITYDTIHTGNDGCVVRTESGDVLKLMPNGFERQVMIPKGSIVTGGCFITER